MGVRILVVEDEALIADDIQRTLLRLGYDVPITAPTGQAALAAAEETRPALVLMDIKLRGPMDGIAAAAAIRAASDIPVVYLTSHSDDATLARAMETSPSGYLLKPFTDRELRTAIEVALHKHLLESRLAERERWLSTILQSIGDAVIVTDSTETITVANTVALELTGWADRSPTGKKLDAVIRLIDRSGGPVDSPVRRMFRSLGGSGPLHSRHESALATAPSDKRESMRPDEGAFADFALLVRADGSRLPIAHSCAPMRDDKGHLTGAVLVFRDATNERGQRQRLEALALLDPLTGIPNRRALERGLRQELKRSSQYGRPLACLMTDIDNFKSINDTYGHAVGDSVLTAVAELLPHGTRADIDLVARFGGEEFVIVLPETQLEHAVAAAERLRARVEDLKLATPGLKVTVSVGVAAGPTEDLLVRADQAMYVAKMRGKNRVEAWDQEAWAASSRSPR